MVPSPDARERDEALIVAYVEGALPPQEAAEVEERLETDGKLASMLDEFLQSKHMAYRLGQAGVLPEAARDFAVSRSKPAIAAPDVASRRPAAHRRWARPQLLRTLAAAVIVAGVVVLWRALSSSPKAVSFEVALLAGAVDSAAYHALLGLPADVVPPGSELRGGATPTGRVLPAAAYLALASAAENRRIEAAFAEPGSSLRAEFFLIPVRLSGPAAVFVVAFDGRSAAKRLFPSTATGSRMLLGAGTHVLPSAAFVSDPDDPSRARFERGYLVPLGGAEVWTLVAVGPAGTDAALAADLDRFLAGLWAAAPPEPSALQTSVVDWFGARGFETRQFTVREP
jgi:hypothetical protein